MSIPVPQGSGISSVSSTVDPFTWHGNARDTGPRLGSIRHLKTAASKASKYSQPLFIITKNGFPGTTLKNASMDTTTFRVMITSDGCTRFSLFKRLRFVPQLAGFSVWLKSTVNNVWYLSASSLFRPRRNTYCVRRGFFSGTLASKRAVRISELHENVLNFSESTLDTLDSNDLNLILISQYLDHN